MRTRSSTYDCNPSPCNFQCKGNEGKCQCDCTCCEKKREAESKRLAAASLHSTSLHSPSDSSDAQSHVAKQEYPSPSEDELQENNSQHFSISPNTIAAVIVGIIVAIILLDLCIFRFPVGRNIRDFLVRKIPFCIAFYS
ncbi:hypothetical protein BBBOND_0212300 [Babesia bigemina]|uniref:Uncharacterized protein n=1 Tax=Babesia bigemina TaxID=5866 RepID=A0A061D6A6_BABBI|nr:hypothetical protein BBBOND_0212300 [Babesia bigemina]CDR96088.1 hypothetical protein BBBOND_0212300 [Babesia bigemina]|eukprot:XP_012768274.1 hypothetical protein BBBOND_0212300 [Babesia bigemina]